MIEERKNNEPLDLSYLRDMSGDNAEFMIEMLDAFQKQTPIYMEDLERAILAEDWKGASEHAHKIKPTFYYIGREDARDHMQEIERNAREMIDIPKISADFAEIKEFVIILYRQLDEASTALAQKL